jgi:hypothetical protein
VFSVSARVMARDDRPSTGNLNSCSQVWWSLAKDQIPCPLSQCSITWLSCHRGEKCRKKTERTGGKQPETHEVHVIKISRIGSMGAWSRNYRIVEKKNQKMQTFLHTQICKSKYKKDILFISTWRYIPDVCSPITWQSRQTWLSPFAPNSTAWYPLIRYLL